MPSETGAPPTDGRPIRFFDPSRFADAAVFLFCGLVLLYSLLIVQQILVGLLAVTMVLVVYYGVRFLRWFATTYRRRTDALESIASSLATMVEREDDGTGGDDANP
jgi:Flp pilus assembly protein TadB